MASHPSSKQAARLATGAPSSSTTTTTTNSVGGKKGPPAIAMPSKPRGRAASAAGASKSPVKTDKISSRLEKDRADPFASKKELQTAFATLYNAGGVPCRVGHGAVTCKLQWDEPPSSLAFDPLLVVLFEGLVETKHPYMFVAHTAAVEALTSKGADKKVGYVLPKLVAPLRAALLSSHAGVFKGALAVFQALAQATGEAILPYLTPLLVPLGRKLFDKAWREDVDNCLQLLFMAAGPGALLAIRSKIPSYTPNVG